MPLTAVDEPLSRAGPHVSAGLAESTAASAAGDVSAGAFGASLSTIQRTFTDVGSLETAFEPPTSKM